MLSTIIHCREAASEKCSSAAIFVTCRLIRVGRYDSLTESAQVDREAVERYDSSRSGYRQRVAYLVVANLANPKRVSANRKIVDPEGTDGVSYCAHAQVGEDYLYASDRTP